MTIEHSRDGRTFLTPLPASTEDDEHGEGGVWPRECLASFAPLEAVEEAMQLSIEASSASSFLTVYLLSAVPPLTAALAGMEDGRAHSIFHHDLLPCTETGPPAAIAYTLCIKNPLVYMLDQCALRVRCVGTGRPVVDDAVFRAASSTSRPAAPMAQHGEQMDRTGGHPGGAI